MPKRDPVKQEFSELDLEREASMADEGGSSGAEMEAEEENPEPLIAVPHSSRLEEVPLAVGGSGVTGPEKPSQSLFDDETLKDVALLIGLIAASGLYLMDALRKRRSSK